MTLSVGGLMLWMGARLQNAVLDQAQHDLELQAFVLANALRDPLEHMRENDKEREGRSLPQLIQVYAETTAARVSVTDRDLRLVASSDRRERAGVAKAGPEFAAARQGQEANSIRWDEVAGEQRLFTAAPIREDDGQAIGYVQLSIPMAPVYASMRAMWWPPLVMGGAVLLLTFLVSLWLARHIAHPLQELTQVSEAMAAGDLGQQVTPGGPDEIERLGNAFNRMAGRVREMLTRQQEFVAHAAHELRSPLTALRLRLEMIEQYGQTDPAMTASYLTQMQGEVEQLQRLIDHLLALAALDEDALPPPAPTDLAPLLYSLADTVSPLVQQAGLRLTVDVPSHLPPVLVNLDPIRMAVYNLLDNAIKYTPAGGQVTLRAEAVEGHLAVSVVDTGGGIPSDALPHIFERFYRVDKARSRRQGGAGLGLSLVQRIAELYQGQVQVESQVGQGSVFTLSLPLVQPG